MITSDSKNSDQRLTDTTTEKLEEKLKNVFIFQEGKPWTFTSFEFWVIFGCVWSIRLHPVPACGGHRITKEHKSTGSLSTLSTAKNP